MSKTPITEEDIEAAFDKWFDAGEALSDKSAFRAGFLSCWSSVRRSSEPLVHAALQSAADTPPPQTQVMGVVEICPECDIAGCKHLRLKNKPLRITGAEIEEAAAHCERVASEYEARANDPNCNRDHYLRAAERERQEAAAMRSRAGIIPTSGATEDGNELLQTIKEFARWHHLNSLTIFIGGKPSDSEIDIEATAWNTITRALVATATEGSHS